MSRPFCAVCQRRPATVTDRIDGRLLMVCADCKDGEVAPPRPEPRIQDRVVKLVTMSPGIVLEQLAQCIDDSEMGRARLRKAVQRAIRDGQILPCASGKGGPYYPTSPVKPCLWCGGEVWCSGTGWLCYRLAHPKPARVQAVRR